jgi:dienelactone hydrolase
MTRSLALLLAPLVAPLAAHAQVSLTYSVAGSTDTLPMTCYPAKKGTAPHPIAVLVHGVDGLGSSSGPQIAAFARQIADAGFVVFVPSYFDRTDGDDTVFTTGSLAQKKALFTLRVDRVATYLPRVQAAIAEARSRKDQNADPSRLGLVGFSLGGGLVIESAESAAAPGKPAAVVDFFGYIRDASLYANAKALPPTMVLHNNRDLFVKVQFSRDLVTALDTAHITQEHKFFDDGNPEIGFHPFTPGSREDDESRSMALRWLTTYLKP